MKRISATYFVSLTFFASLTFAGYAIGGPRESAIAEVRAADHGFNAMAQEKGFAKAYAAFVAPNAVMIRPGQANPVLPSVEAAIQWPAGTSLSWAAEQADASEDGTMAYTWGRLVFQSQGTDGKPVSSIGNYSIVWKRDVDRSWRVVLDISSPGAKPTSKKLE